MSPIDEDRPLPPARGHDRASLAASRRLLRQRGRSAGFTIVETAIGMSIAAVGFLGAWTMALQAGRMVSAAEEEALVTSALEQRIDQLRELDWPSLTGASGISTALNVPVPALHGLPATTETWVIAPYNLPTARTITGVRAIDGSRSVSISGETAATSTATAVEVTTRLRWTGRRSNRPAERSLRTVISRGGISKSAP